MLCCLSLVLAGCTEEKAAPMTTPTKETAETAVVLSNQVAWDVYRRYVDAWKAIPDEQRRGIAESVLADGIRYSTPRHATGGRQTVIDDMAAFQAKFPGGHFDIGDVSAHHDVALLTWILVSGDGTVVAKGHDQIRVSADLAITELITFAPSVTAP
jgi:hypothetical protein